MKGISLTAPELISKTFDARFANIVARDQQFYFPCRDRATSNFLYRNSPVKGGRKAEEKAEYTKRELLMKWQRSILKRKRWSLNLWWRYKTNCWHCHPRFILQKEREKTETEMKAERKFKEEGRDSKPISGADGGRRNTKLRLHENTEATEKLRLLLARKKGHGSENSFIVVVAVASHFWSHVGSDERSETMMTTTDLQVFAASSKLKRCSGKLKTTSSSLA